MNISNLDVTKFNLLNTKKILYKYLPKSEFPKYFKDENGNLKYDLESQLIDPSKNNTALVEYKSITVNGESLIDDNYLYIVDQLDDNSDSLNKFSSLNAIDDRFKLSTECVVFDAEYKGVPIINTLSVKNNYNIENSRCLYLKLDNITLFKFFLLPGVVEISFLTENNDLAGQLICYSETEISPNNSMREYLSRYASNLSRLLGINNIGNLKETDFYRTVTVDISGYASSNNVQLLVHKKLPFCHESITAYELYDFIKNYRITPKLLIDSIFRTNRLALINGSLICDDFTKFYAGSPTSYLVSKNFRFTVGCNTILGKFTIERYNITKGTWTSIGSFNSWDSESLTTNKLSYGDKIKVTVGTYSLTKRNDSSSIDPSYKTNGNYYKYTGSNSGKFLTNHYYIWVDKEFIEFNPSMDSNILFTHWSDGRKETVLTVNIDSDKNLFGHFKYDIFDVSVILKYKLHELINDESNNMSEEVKDYYKNNPNPGYTKFIDRYDIKDSNSIYNDSLFNYKIFSRGQNSRINVKATLGYKIFKVFEINGYDSSRNESSTNFDILGKYTGTELDLSRIGQSGSKLTGNIYDLTISDTNLTSNHKYYVVFTEDAFKVRYWKNDPEFIKLDSD